MILNKLARKCSGSVMNGFNIIAMIIHNRKKIENMQKIIMKDGMKKFRNI